METSGPALWLIVLTVGVIVLGAAIVYGMWRNRKLTLSERVLSEVETKREYEREDKDFD
jgi:FtsZ-interacting cell division protein ZipA